ncbi:putative clathrin assembly protein at1g03050 [Phtheirospermum japonicum]|uniref:Putative clathrin assembly protein at1g03050 n=1 Tax=Phtheirospermum japonicum TaxID=374723 RepID=A0A830BHN0_9LAMI|nr:putative clathrin assembly protein at1g03050 [Phtheirospermum japonicum]
MAPSKIRKAIGAVKDHTSIGLAKVSSGSSSIAALEVAVVKATRHEEHPPEDRHISEILSLTSYSHTLVSACVAIIARRLDRTKNWVVALKALVLVHRLLAKGGRAYEQEIFFSTRRGTRFLNMSDFRDASTSSSSGKSCDYSAFVRTYALYLDERLEFRMQGRRGKRGGYGYHHRDEEEEGGRHSGGAASGEMVVAGPTPVREMKIESVFSRAHHLKQLLERFLACRPTGAAKHNRVVVVALYPIVKESFQLYYDVTEITGTLIDRFMQLDVPDMVRVHEIFFRVSKQLDELDQFYDWCKTVRVVRSSESPRVEKISRKKLEMMDDFIHQKTAMLRNGRARSPDPKPVPEPGPEEGTVKELSLVPSEGFVEEEKENELEEKTEIMETEKKGQEIGDLLNLGEDLTSTGPQGDELALALFDDSGIGEVTTTTTNPWEAFKDSSDWETALVQSASRWSNQKAPFTGGFDMMMLDSMYRQGGANTTLPGTGSASSVIALGGPTVLALPAPPGGAHSLADPFAASLAVAPPAYVQMSEMEKKQRLLVEEQLVWQQYARGQVGLPNVQQQNSYPYVAMW